MYPFLRSLKSNFTIRRLTSSRNGISTSQSDLHCDVDEQLGRLIDEAKDRDDDDRMKIGNNDGLQGKYSSSLYLISRPFLVTILLASLLLATLAIGNIAILHSPSSEDSHHQQIAPEIIRQPCGSSPGEARSKGCHFDTQSFCWLPTECYDAELSRDFDASMSVNLQWFLDQNRTQPLSHEQVLTGQFTGLYVSWEYHVKHCTAMWKKMHRAMMGDLGRRAIDSYIGSYNHTKHCEHMLLRGRGAISWDTINTSIWVKYPDCGV